MSPTHVKLVEFNKSNDLDVTEAVLLEPAFNKVTQQIANQNPTAHGVIELFNGRGIVVHAGDTLEMIQNRHKTTLLQRR